VQLICKTFTIVEISLTKLHDSSREIKTAIPGKFALFLELLTAAYDTVNHRLYLEKVV